ncbi:hypothetical protein ANO11243_067800 [Dothideomycetidae sp. 11243]|nr:hypothetical protein ANO11243_067800 [fungal sp. No.11243]
MLGDEATTTGTKPLTGRMIHEAGAALLAIAAGLISTNVSVSAVRNLSSPRIMLLHSQIGYLAGAPAKTPEIVVSRKVGVPPFKGGKVFLARRAIVVARVEMSAKVAS